MSSIILSVVNDGYTITESGRLLHSKFYKDKSGRVRDRIMRNLERGLVHVKEIVDHSSLVIELNDKFVYTHLTDDVSIPRTDQEMIYKLSSILDECDARVLVKQVKNPQAARYSKYAEREEEAVESVVGLFEGLIEGEDL